MSCTPTVSTHEVLYKGLRLALVKQRVDVVFAHGISENDLRLFLSRMAFDTLEQRDVAKINRMFECFIRVSWGCTLKLDAYATPNPTQVEVELTACCFAQRLGELLAK